MFYRKVTGFESPSLISVDLVLKAFWRCRIGERAGEGIGKNWRMHFGRSDLHWLSMGTKVVRLDQVPVYENQSRFAIFCEGINHGYMAGLVSAPLKSMVRIQGQPFSICKKFVGVHVVWKVRYPFDYAWKRKRLVMPCSYKTMRGQGHADTKPSVSIVNVLQRNKFVIDFIYWINVE